MIAEITRDGNIIFIPETAAEQIILVSKIDKPAYIENCVLPAETLVEFMKLVFEKIKEE